MSRVLTVGTVAVGLFLGRASQADVVVERVAVGDAGNAPDTRYETPGYGGVDDEYRIGKYEVSNGQYIEFLNAVAAVGDQWGLYNTEMAGIYGGIVRTGSGTEGDPWAYGPKGGDANWLSKPVNYVSWGDAARFCNWLHNGQPTGAQGLSTTDDGSYYLNGATTDKELMAVTREPDATWVIPTEDEWYKAAYYKGGGTDAGYWEYATQSDMVPTSEPPPGTDLVNGSANYYDGGFVDPTYYTTKVGAYDAKPSDSAYNTSDQSGNVWEWNEDAYGDGSSRGLSGGSWICPWFILSASFRNSDMPTFEAQHVGFRLAGPAQFILADYAEFQNCFSGIGGPVLPGCDIFDFEPDGDVDLDDYSRFLLTFGGP